VKWSIELSIWVPKVCIFWIRNRHGSDVSRWVYICNRMDCNFNLICRSTIKSWRTSNLYISWIKMSWYRSIIKNVSCTQEHDVIKSKPTWNGTRKLIRSYWHCMISQVSDSCILLFFVLFFFWWTKSISNPKTYPVAQKGKKKKNKKEEEGSNSHS